MARRRAHEQASASWNGRESPSTEKEFQAIRLQVAAALGESARAMNRLGTEMRLRDGMPGPGWRLRALGVTLRLLYINARLLKLAVALHGAFLGVEGGMNGSLSPERAQEYVDGARRLIGVPGGDQ